MQRRYTRVAQPTEPNGSRARSQRHRGPQPLRSDRARCTASATRSRSASCTSSSD